jgi:TRAP-type C4-dicarboxylate transport system permease small subunit
MEKKPGILDTKGIQDTLKRIDVAFATLLMFSVFVDIMLQIISRVLPGRALPWTVEMGEILLAGIIWIGIGYGVLNNLHIRFDMILTKLPHKTKKIFYVAGNILFAVFLIILAYYAVYLLMFYLKSNTRTPALRWNKAFIRWPVLVGCVLGAIRLLIQAWFFATEKIPLPASDTDNEVNKAIANAEAGDSTKGKV